MDGNTLLNIWPNISGELYKKIWELTESWKIRKKLQNNGT